jgi:hypothetical protein
MLGMIFILASLLLLPTIGSAQQPVPKIGSCPSGYASSASYCTPMNDRSPAAIVKQGQCPSNWMTSGAYCLQVTMPRR